VLNIHGEADLTVPITGGTNFAGVSFPGQDETVDTLASKFNCAPAISSPRGTLVLPVGDGSAQKEVDAKVATFGECTGNVEVEQWTLPGVDHFMETPTSYAVFDAALEWLMSKNRRNGQSPA
jgi:poly(3-hydroxybutyrate) depolymerase